MNEFSGRIKALTNRGQLTTLQVGVGDFTFSAIVTDVPSETNYLQLGNPVQVMIKESEVIIARGDNIQISLRNQVKGVIQEVYTSDLMAKLIIATSIGPMTSVITARSVERLGLAAGVEVIVMIKTNEVMISG